jgi:hypothetical protein
LVPSADAAIAFSIACVVVRKLEDSGYRFLDAIVPAVVRGVAGEHDLIAERRGLQNHSSIEVKCKTIRQRSSLLEKAMQQVRDKALALWNPSKFSERVIFLVEYGPGKLEEGWRCLWCEAYDGVRWKSVGEWPASPQISPAATDRKRKRQTTPTRSTSSRSSSNNKHDSTPASGKWVFIGGEKYTTLNWYLGKPSAKSQWQVAGAACSPNMVELRRGDYKILPTNSGKELLEDKVLSNFNEHRWVDTVIPPSRSDRGCLQVKLLKEGSEANGKSLYNWKELGKCTSLSK